MTKPANDPATDYKALVREGYDRCALAYAHAREKKARQMATVSLRDEAPYTENGFFGVTMYWSNYSIYQYRDEILTSLGFSILKDGQLGHGYRSGVKEAPEVHPLFFAQKT
jgi:hypothetical protein